MLLLIVHHTLHRPVVSNTNIVKDLAAAQPSFAVELRAALCRFNAAQAGRANDDAAALTSSPHGPIKHRGRGRDLAALQEQVIAKLGRQVCGSCGLPQGVCSMERR